MPFCCVPFCTSGLDNTTDISFHAVPDKPENLRANWFHAISQGIWSTSNNNKSGWLVCSKHFQPCDFTDGKLNAGAIPSLFLYKQKYIVRSKGTENIKQIQECNGHFSTRNLKMLDQTVAAKSSDDIGKQSCSVSHSILRSLLEKPVLFKPTGNVIFEDVQDVIPNKERQGSCHICKKIFISSFYLNNHVMLCHYEQCVEEKNPNIIQTVNSAFFSGGSLVERQTKINQTDIKGKQSNCFVCNNMLLSHLCLQKHIETCHKQEFICKICSKICNSMKGLNAHKRRHLKEGSYLCDGCGKHLEITSITPQLSHRKYSYNCSHCGCMCLYHKDLKTDRKMLNKMISYICYLCNKKFDKVEKWKTHLRMCTNEKFICNVCRRIFSEITYLEFHRMIHIDGSCHIERCLKNCIFKSSTKGQTANKKYICHMCGKIFSRLAVMYSHIYAHIKKKPYMCEICGYQFAYRTALCAHLRKHSGIKPYTCNLCCKRFTIPPEKTNYKHT